MSDDLKIRMPEWARHMYNRLLAKIEGSGSSGTRSVASNNINSDGTSGSFTTSDGKTVTVTDGVVTSINSEERR